jgi:hypothetical protein
MQKRNYLRYFKTTPDQNTGGRAAGTNGQSSQDRNSGQQSQEERFSTDMTFRFNLIKGQLAESIVQQLFTIHNYKVFPYGMENTIPGIIELLQGPKCDVYHQIRQMPDFIIQEKSSKRLFFIEVKYKADGHYNYQLLKSPYIYEQGYVIVITKLHIKCLSVAELKEGKEINKDCDNLLSNRTEFNLDSRVVSHFTKIAQKFYKEM